MLRLWRGRAIGKLAIAVAAVSLLGVATPVAAAPKATLVAVVVGAGSVSSQPAGIACPGSCSATFPLGTKVTLVPKPDKGSTFLRWGGSCTGTKGCKVDLSSLATVAAQFSASPAPTPPKSGLLASGVPVKGHVTSGAGVTYKLLAVAGDHFALDITNPHVSSGGSLQIQVYDSSGANDVNGVGFNTSPVEVDFTPTAAQAGITKVVISPYGGSSTGTFTLTYARDVTGEAESGVTIHTVLPFEGQDADYTFDAVTGHHLTLAITNPSVAAGASMQIQVYDSSGANDVNGAGFNTTPVEVDFTPTAAQAGPTTVVISDYGGAATGSFNLTYAKDVTGQLKLGARVQGMLKWAGQDADYTFKAVPGRPVSLAITNPSVAAGASMQIQVYDSSGANDVNGAGFNTTPVEVDFTPTAAQAGPTTVVISDYGGSATGSFTLTYKT
jgi:hypothetical protein